MPTTRITVLMDNTVRRFDCIGEHGLSLLVERPDGKLLWDTGQSGRLIENADNIGVQLNDLTGIALSHGHYDHTGGLIALSARCGQVPVYAHPEVLSDRLSASGSPDGKPHHIGCPFDEQTLVAHGAEFVFSDEPQRILEGVYLTGEIPRTTPFEDTGGAFFVDETLDTPDSIADDQALLVETDEGPVLLLGCCHAGLVNTIGHVSKQFGIKRFRLIAGGMHLVNASPERLNATLASLGSERIHELSPGHCTGDAACCAFHHILSGQVTPFGVGRQWSFSI